MGSKVLLVDDSPDLLEVMALYIRHTGIEVVEAGSLAAVQALGPVLDEVTLAILDVNLGLEEPSGIDVCNWLRAHHYGCHVVFLTGHATDHPMVRAAAHADGEVLTKPVEIRTLVSLARGYA